MRTLNTYIKKKVNWYMHYGITILFIILTFTTKEIFSQVNVSDGKTCTASSTNSGYPASGLVNNTIGATSAWMASKNTTTT